MKQQKYHRALTIAGFDVSGGAGIQADLKVFSALGCYGMTVLTALPVQNTRGVQSIYSISEKCVGEQLLAIIDDIGIDALKLGMLHRSEIILTIAQVLDQYTPLKMVVDPVMIAKSGDHLLNSNAIELMKQRIFPIATVLTPNLPEASALLNRTITTKNQMEQAAYDLTALGPQAVVVKGGHLMERSCDDCLCIKAPRPEFFWFSSPRYPTKNTHGTGCTFSAAITAYLCQGMDIYKAVKLAKTYISNCIEAGSKYDIGHGHGPVHHFHHLW